MDRTAWDKLTDDEKFKYVEDKKVESDIVLQENSSLRADIVDGNHTLVTEIEGLKNDFKAVTADSKISQRFVEKLINIVQSLATKETRFLLFRFKQKGDIALLKDQISEMKSQISKLNSTLEGLNFSAISELNNNLATYQSSATHTVVKSFVEKMESRGF